MSFVKKSSDVPNYAAFTSVKNLLYNVYVFIKEIHKMCSSIMRDESLTAWTHDHYKIAFAIARCHHEFEYESTIILVWHAHNTFLLQNF